MADDLKNDLAALAAHYLEAVGEPMPDSFMLEIIDSMKIPAFTVKPTDPLADRSVGARAVLSHTFGDKDRRPFFWSDGNGVVPGLQPPADRPVKFSLNDVRWGYQTFYEEKRLPDDRQQDEIARFKARYRRAVGKDPTPDMIEEQNMRSHGWSLLPEGSLYPKDSLIIRLGRYCWYRPVTPDQLAKVNTVLEGADIVDGPENELELSEAALEHLLATSSNVADGLHNKIKTVNPVLEQPRKADPKSGPSKHLTDLQAEYERVMHPDFKKDWPVCAQCNKTVEMAEVWTDPGTLAARYAFRCHGAASSFVLSDQDIIDGKTVPRVVFDDGKAASASNLGRSFMAKHQADLRALYGMGAALVKEEGKPDPEDGHFTIVNGRPGEPERTYKMRPQVAELVDELCRRREQAVGVTQVLPSDTSIRTRVAAIDGVSQEQAHQIALLLERIFQTDHEGSDRWLSDHCSPIGSTPIKALEDGRTEKVIAYLEAAAP
mgnify:CR=1 FL=1